MENVGSTIDRESKEVEMNFIEKNSDQIVAAFEMLNTGLKLHFLAALLESEAKIINIDRDELGQVRFVVKNDDYLKLK